MNKKCLIGNIAQLFNISSDTLRYYEKAGILKPTKDVNGYRNYNMDDIIKIIDIMFYRGLDIAIKDIVSITTSMDIGAIIDVMGDNEEIISAKIANLAKLQTKLKIAKERFSTANNKLGQCEIVTTPTYLYEIVDEREQEHENLLEVMNIYRKINENWIDSLQLAIYLDYATLQGARELTGAKYGIIVEEQNILCSSLREQYRSFRSFTAKEYLYTVIRTTYDKSENEYLLLAINWLKLNNRECVGDMIGRYLATSYENHSSMDYYEVWLPLK